MWLKGQCHQIFDLYCFAQKAGAPYEQTKTVLRPFLIFFLAKKFDYEVRNSPVCVVNDFKISERPSKFVVNVRIVIAMSA